MTTILIEKKIWTNIQEVKVWTSCLLFAIFAPLESLRHFFVMFRLIWNVSKHVGKYSGFRRVSLLSHRTEGHGPDRDPVSDTTQQVKIWPQCQSIKKKSQFKKINQQFIKLGCYIFLEYLTVIWRTERIWNNSVFISGAYYDHIH